jgi:alkylation response protein AidB-like acyl-CoA dehydrogenase
MQTLGALGMTLELPLNALWQKARLMRMYEGPSEVHRQSIARRRAQTQTSLRTEGGIR